MAAKTVSSIGSTRTHPPQAFVSSYAPRIRTFGNALLAPVVQPATVLPPLRTTKRGTTAVNYADDFDDDDFDDSDSRRRPTGLRSLRQEASTVSSDALGKQGEAGRELDAPVAVQGIWRDWMGKARRFMTEKQQQIQAVLPLTLVPIRIDLDVPSFRPEPPLPVPQNSARDFGIDDTLPAYTRPEATPAYRLKDAFLWNLHEALMTPDQFARTLVDELDLAPDKKLLFTMDVAKQIREQLEQYAGIALHPLFQPTSGTAALNGDGAPSNGASRVQTPLPAASTPQPNGITNGDHSTPQDASEAISATATQPDIPSISDMYNPDDTYRCVVSLSINLVNRLYTDRFEWSLIHPPGLAETFAKQTCADLGLTPEWASALAHAIYEAVLRLKKEVCENGGLLGVSGYGGELDNDAAMGEAGWRYCDEAVSGVSGERWEPRVEVLSKEEIEKREGDRERQLRRVRRETARYSSAANVGTPGGAGDAYSGFGFGGVPQSGGQADGEEQRMGRGERSKKKRRFRSLSPLGRETPGGDSRDVAGYGGGAALSDAERQSWRCRWCFVWGSAVWAVRDGPMGQKSLCHNCGYLWERDKKLPPWNRELFKHELGVGMVMPRGQHMVQHQR